MRLNDIIRRNAAFVQQALAELENLTIIEAEATAIVTEGGIGHSPSGIRRQPPAGTGSQEPDAESQAPTQPRRRVVAVRVVSSGPEPKEFTLPCRAAILTAGTFLRGVLHCGKRVWPGGRYGEPAAEALSRSLQSLGIRLGRLKTGTCPRVAAESIDYDRCERQDGDETPVAFSFLTDRLEVEQVPCWITATNRCVHEAIKANLHRAPLFSGQITSTGPRYCPSLELKVQRFPDKHAHQVFLEPEGRGTNWVYLNGLSTSLPVDLQDFMVHAVAGLERAQVLRWGYAIEYDWVPTHQIDATLETKKIRGLFPAGNRCSRRGSRFD